MNTRLYEEFNQESTDILLLQVMFISKDNGHTIETICNLFEEIKLPHKAIGRDNEDGSYTVDVMVESKYLKSFKDFLVFIHYRHPDIVISMLGTPDLVEKCSCCGFYMEDNIYLRVDVEEARYVCPPCAVKTNEIEVDTMGKFIHVRYDDGHSLQNIKTLELQLKDMDKLDQWKQDIYYGLVTGVTEKHLEEYVEIQRIKDEAKNEIVNSLPSSKFNAAVVSFYKLFKSKLMTTLEDILDGML
jgi:hypothetical protein